LPPVAQASACVLSFYFSNVVIRVGWASRPSRASIHLPTLLRFTKRPCLLASAEQMYSRREAERWTGGTPVPLARGRTLDGRDARPTRIRSLLAFATPVASGLGKRSYARAFSAPS